MAGPNHILPTAKTSVFDSPVGVDTFIKSSSLISLTKSGFSDIKEAASIMAEAEGLPIHKKSLEVRENDNE